MFALGFAKYVGSAKGILVGHMRQGVGRAPGPLEIPSREQAYRLPNQSSQRLTALRCQT